MPRRPGQRRLLAVRRTRRQPAGHALPRRVRRRVATGGLLRQVRQRHVPRRGGQDRGRQEMWAVDWVRLRRVDPLQRRFRLLAESRRRRRERWDPV